jgi:hypothetical protein
MTSKRFLESQFKTADRLYSGAITALREANFKLFTAENKLAALKADNQTQAEYIASRGEHLHALHQFIDDIFIIEPQLKHLLTAGTWDFERAHRAAEALRNEDALASVGYTNQCVDWPDNVTPLFPFDPTEGEGAA